MSQEGSEVDFLHADKHLNFLQVDTTLFTVFMCSPGLSQVPIKIYNIFVTSQERS